MTYRFRFGGGTGEGAGRPVHDPEFAVLAALLVGRGGAGGRCHGVGVEDGVLCGVVTLYGCCE